jgi:hypothetical protein
MRFLVLLALALSVANAALAQTASEDPSVRSADEIPEDMPDAPENAPPAEAPAVGATEDRPPHPKTPDPLEEVQPTAEMLAKTMYHWLPGHWVWTGQQFEWKNGQWIYKVKEMILVPPRWEWDGKQWVFHSAGWAKPGTNVAVYSPTPAPGGPDAAENSEQAPASSSEPKDQKEAQTTVYVWVGVYTAPLIVYPIWHPHYHYHWYHRHPYYRRPPAYRHRRYHYAKAHHRYHNPSARPHPSSPSRPSQHPAHKPSTRPSQPSHRPSTKPSQPSHQPATKPSQPSHHPSGGAAHQPSQQRRRTGGRRR